MLVAWLWIPATLIAAGAQTARNAMQRRLVDTIGTAGATQVRFLYGFPFAVLFLAAVLLISGEGLPGGGRGFVGYLFLGAITQILATGLMLAAMQERSFAVITALLKTEAVQIAVFGTVVLGDRISTPGVSGIVLATVGVVLMTFDGRASALTRAGPKAVVLGVVAGSIFALSAIGYRGAILSLDSGSFVLRATTTLAFGLGLQTFLLTVWMSLFDRPALMGSLREWRSSLSAGFLGAFASQFWFIGFSLTAAANVRTLALVEVVMAQAVSRRLAQTSSRREIAGIGLIVLGVVLLLSGAA